jgi:hypothetical protein
MGGTYMKGKGTYAVNVKVGDVEISVEGAESGVVKIVEALSEILREPRKRISPLESKTEGQLIQPAPRSSPIDIRTFFNEKKPSSDVEAAAVAAYYYQYLAPDAERRNSIDSTLLQEAFRHAKRPLPSKTIYTLQNARGAGYLDSTGETGRFRLNPVGYNLVEHSLGEPQKEARTSKHPRRFPRS